MATSYKEFEQKSAQRIRDALEDALKQGNTMTTLPSGVETKDPAIATVAAEYEALGWRLFQIGFVDGFYSIIPGEDFSEGQYQSFNEPNYRGLLLERLKE